MTTTEAKRVYLQNENDEILLPYSSQAIEDGDGNVITDTYLKKVDARLGVSIGTIFPCVCSANWTPENALPVDGTEYASTQFPTLWTDYLTATTPKLAVCTYAEYAADITAYGQCAKFAVDTVNNKFKVPTIKDGSYITQAKSNDEIGKAYNESLPNIHGYFTGGSWGLGLTGATGAFTPTRTSTNATGTSGNAFDRGAYDGALFDASKSSAVYADNAKVQGDNVRLRWFVVVANGTVSQTAMDWSAWATSLNGKLNTDVSTNISATGKSFVAGLAMPSEKFTSLTVGASGSTYTAPANGWVVFGMQSTAATQNVLLSKDGGAWAISWSHAALLNLYVYVPVTKGEIFKVGYTAGGQKLIFRFYYAEGDAPESEA